MSSRIAQLLQISLQADSHAIIHCMPTGISRLPFRFGEGYLLIRSPAAASLIIHLLRASIKLFTVYSFATYIATVFC